MRQECLCFKAQTKPIIIPLTVPMISFLSLALQNLFHTIEGTRQDQFEFLKQFKTTHKLSNQKLY